jgi:hypothetical protein
VPDRLWWDAVLNDNERLREAPLEMFTGRKKALGQHVLLITPAGVLFQRIRFAFGETPYLFFMRGIKKNYACHLIVETLVEGSRIKTTIECPTRR